MSDPLPYANSATKGHKDEPSCEECGRAESACRCFECPTCNGRGTVNPLTAPKGFFCVGSTDCPSCDGTGEMQ